MTTILDPRTKSPLIAFLELNSRYWVNHALNAAAKLGIADVMSYEAKSVDEIAQASQTHAPSLYRLLRTLASVGVFAEVEPHRFALTPMAEYLRTDNPQSLRHQLMMHCAQWHLQFTKELINSIKDGQPAVTHAYQINTLYEYFDRDAEAGELFNLAMVGLTRNFHIPLVKAYDFSGYSKVVDLAGGQGALISEILKANPHLQGVLFDLPQAVDQAADFLAEQGVADRCERVGGDMFKSIPKGADLYTISYSIIDCNDESAIALLSSIRQGMADNAKLLVIDSIAPTGDEYHWVKWLDLDVLSIGKGGARTESEFRELFGKGGFELVRIINAGTPVSAMELIPIG
ncbi:methyltransferase [Aerosakkonema funiforme]|uniref:methyltransferase n=1 Tax=Aerosakkonema funiforme TaxID=1246630 RepID=UPI0035B7378D